MRNALKHVGSRLSSAFPQQASLAAPPSAVQANNTHALQPPTLGSCCPLFLMTGFTLLSTSAPRHVVDKVRCCGLVGNWRTCGLIASKFLAL